jgi:quinoprotein glucose dehydrogenase
LRTKEMANDFKLRNNARLLASDFGKSSKEQLRQLLAHPDRRIRQKAQFALIDQEASDALEAAATSRESRVARLHGIWGLGNLARNGKYSGEVLQQLLSDDDADARAMSARMIGDLRDPARIDDLRKLLSDDNSRVKREAANALARIGEASPKASEDLFAMLRHNDDRDGVLRHAGVFALAAVASRQELVARSQDASRAVQRAVLLALARQRAPEVKTFLKHEDEQFRYEAARAIYELPIAEAMQDLALFVYDNEPDSERIDWRAIQAARMIGGVEQGEALVHMATQTNHSRKIRLEALAVLAEWREPHGQCRVIGNWRPCQHPDADIAVQNFRGSSAMLLKDKVTAEATANTINKLGLREMAGSLAELVANQDMPPAARVAALNALADLKTDELQAALASIDAKAPVSLRKRAVALLSHSSPEKAVPVLGSLLENASTGEKQAALEALGNLQHASATELLRTWLQRYEQGQVDTAIVLDLQEAASKHEALQPTVTALVEASEQRGPLAAFAACVDGGDAREGRKVFHDFEATRCTRCHTLNGNGGNAGPVLNGVGTRLPADKLLESLIMPSAAIAEGFGTTTIEAKDGMIYAGVITKDQDGAITLVDIQGKEHQIQSDRIRSRSANKDSAMPMMGASLSKRQIRDLIAFLKKQT